MVYVLPLNKWYFTATMTAPIPIRWTNAADHGACAYGPVSSMITPYRVKLAYEYAKASVPRAAYQDALGYLRLPRGKAQIIRATAIYVPRESEDRSDIVAEHDKGYGTFRDSAIPGVPNVWNILRTQ